MQVSIDKWLTGARRMMVSSLALKRQLRRQH